MTPQNYVDVHSKHDPRTPLALDGFVYKGIHGECGLSWTYEKPKL